MEVGLPSYTLREGNCRGRFAKLHAQRRKLQEEMTHTHTTNKETCNTHEQHFYVTIANLSHDQCSSLISDAPNVPKMAAKALLSVYHWHNNPLHLIQGQEFTK